MDDWGDSPVNEVVAEASVVDSEPAVNVESVAGILKRYLDSHSHTVEGTVNGAYHVAVLHCRCPICTDALAALGIDGHYEFP